MSDELMIIQDASLAVSIVSYASLSKGMLRANYGAWDHGTDICLVDLSPIQPTPLPCR